MRLLKTKPVGAPWRRFAYRTAVLALACLFTPPHARAQETTTSQTAPEVEQPCERPDTDQLAGYDLVPGVTLPRSIAAPLTSVPGDPAAGLAIVTDQERGNCISCHAIKSLRKAATSTSSPAVAAFGIHGTIGPQLDGITDKYTQAELRLLIVNPKLALPQADTIMPAYHHVTDLTLVATSCVGRALLTAAEVEDVVAYLLTLRGDE